MKPTTEEILAHEGSVPLEVAARYLGIGRKFLASAIINCAIPIGAAVWTGSRYKFDIRPKALVEYQNHGFVSLKMEGKL